MTTSKAEEIMEQFLEMEVKNDFFERLQIKQIKIWHYIRYEIYNMMSEILGNIFNPNRSKKLLNEKNTLYDWIDENVLKNQLLISHKDVLIINHPRRAKQGDYYKCLYTDEWLKNFARSYYVFELKYDGKIHYKPVKTENLRYIDKDKFIKIFNKKYRFDSYRSDCEKCANELIQILEQEFTVNLPYRYKKDIKQLVYNMSVNREIVRDYYGYILERIRPKVIIYVIGYGFDQMMLAELGKELGIPTIELEHGHTTDTLPYVFKEKYTLKSLPDYFFVTGQQDKEYLQMPLDDDHIYVVGSPELDAKINYYKKKLFGKHKKTIITFISSGEAEIAEAAMELCGKLDNSKYYVYLKLHPSEYTSWRRKYRNIEKTGLHVVDDSKHDLHYYLAVSDFVIGIASTALFEATRFNCNILIYKRGLYFKSKTLIETGCGIYIDSMDEAVDKIESIKTKRKPSEYYYCSNSCKRMYKAIDDIISKSQFQKI